ncbi:MAG: TRAP transporter substrate-binding protein DctP [Deltaproteobacteria bacterium]|nr:TRAP transporter substrate-binding protein DctP [Deltaproteobacteria bacterium]
MDRICSRRRTRVGRPGGRGNDVEDRHHFARRHVAREGVSRRGRGNQVRHRRTRRVEVLSRRRDGHGQRRAQEDEGRADPRRDIHRGRHLGGLSRLSGDEPADAVQRLRRGGPRPRAIDPIIVKGLSEKGYEPIIVMEIGFVYMMSDSELRTMDDLKGKKVWIPENDPIGQAVFETIGVSPVPLPLPDVLTGLRTGLVDTYANSPIGTVTLQWFTKAKYVLDRPLLYTYSVFALSDKAWSKVPEGDRETVRKILRKHLSEVNSSVRQANREALDTLRKQGLTFHAERRAKQVDSKRRRHGHRQARGQESLFAVADRQGARNDRRLPRRKLIWRRRLTKRRASCARCIAPRTPFWACCSAR